MFSAEHILLMSWHPGQDVVVYTHPFEILHQQLVFPFIVKVLLSVPDRQDWVSVTGHFNCTLYINSTLSIPLFLHHVCKCSTNWSKMETNTDMSQTEVGHKEDKTWYLAPSTPILYTTMTKPKLFSCWGWNTQETAMWTYQPISSHILWIHSFRMDCLFQ